MLAVVEDADFMGKHAFLCYIRQDAPSVDRLQVALEAAGIQVWRDTTELWPGDDWREKIRQAIAENSLAFIACFSRASLERQKSRQNEELALAVEELQRHRPDVPWLIPVRLDDCEIPDRSLGGGRMLGSLEPADLFGERREQETARLVTVITRILGQQHSYLRSSAQGTTSHLIMPEHTPEQLRAVPTAESGNLLHDVLPRAPALSRSASGQASSMPDVEFIGRHDDLTIALEALRDPKVPLITIKGMGGIGKTTLAQEAVRRATDEGLFRWTVWKSAQAERFAAQKLVRAGAADYSFDALLSDILVQSAMQSSASAPLAVKLAIVSELLSTSRVVIILDNLETVPDRDELIASLFDVLGRSTLLVTSRYAVAHLRSFTIDIGGLSPEDGIDFLNMIARRQNNLNLRNAPQETLARIHDVTGGAPLAMMLVSGEMNDQPVDFVLRAIEQAGLNKLSYEFYSFMFKRCWNDLNGTCRRVLVAMRHFKGRPTSEALRYTVDIPEESFYEAATILVRRSLLAVTLDKQEARYSIHPLTRNFINTDIAAKWD